MRRTVLFAICLMTAFPCWARIIIVDDNGPADFNNIQAAINDANNGDEIIILQGIYTGDGNRDIEYKGKAIIVRSIDPNHPGVVATTVIDCYKTNDYIRHRGFKFHNGEGPNSVLSGITIKRGYESGPGYAKGGGIYCTGSSPIIEKCIIADNQALWGWPGYGGGIYCESKSKPVISNCIIIGNKVSGNYGDPSGGIGQDAYGGGLYASNDSNPQVRNCLIINNTAKGGSAYQGISSYHGGNGYGGGSCGNITLINCAIVGNTASGGTGIPDGTGYGGGSHDGTGSIVMTGCILWDNYANYGPQIYGNASVTYSDIEGGWVGEGNINSDPLFANASSGDFHLKSQAGRWNPNIQSWVKDDVTSPCIDAGDPNSDWKTELWPHSKRINMGAYGGTPQASMSLSNTGNIADFDKDDDLDFNDVKLFTEKWLYQAVLLTEDIDRNGDVNFLDFSIFGNEWSSENAEASITYQISPCGGGPLVVKGLDATRFTVTVNGHYIHFEDKMTANCCPDKLELVMEVYGNQIIIYEREFLTHPCFCICDYPIKAELGPFEPGGYLLSVYEDFGGFIGSTTVIIE